MKKVILFFCIIAGLISVNELRGQNLVPNCSFEDTIHCPAGSLGNISWCKDWYSAGTNRSSPDYFKDCGIYNSVPYNQLGFQYAATGNSYTGIIPWTGPENIQYEKEMIGVKLIEPLSVGKQYYISFKVSFTISDVSCYATNKTGILLSTHKYDNSNPAPVKNFAHIYMNKIITDTLYWHEIKGWITADSAYQYVNIGDFFDNKHTDTVKVFSPPYLYMQSYHYIDDICVSLDSNKCSCVSGDFIQENNHEQLISAYYNQETEIITIKNLLPTNEKPEIRIYDITGKLINRLILQNRENDITTKNLIRGIYLINIKTNMALYNFKFFIN